jgi:hypothetical protein
MAGAIGAIASAAAATTNAVRVASRNARPHVDRGLQALAGSVTGASRPVVKAAGIAAGASARASRGVMTRATSGAAAASRAALIATQNAARDAATASRAGAVVAGSGYRAAATVVTITAAGAATAVSRTIPAGSRALRRVVDGSGVVVAASRRGDQALHWARARGRRLALTSATALVVVGAALVVTGAITWGVVGRHRGDAAEGPSVVSRVVVAHPEIARERGGLERSSRASSTPRPAGRALARADNVAEPHTVTAVTTADRREEIGAVPRSESIARIPSETERSVEVPAVRTVVGTDDAARIRLEIQQTLRNRGLLRENAADRWGVAVDVSPSGDVMLEGAVRDVALSQEAVRRAQDVAKTRHVTHNIRVIAAGDAP